MFPEASFQSCKYREGRPVAVAYGRDGPSVAAAWAYEVGGLGRAIEVGVERPLWLITPNSRQIPAALSS